MICGRCNYKSVSEAPRGDWDTCPNCDGFFWDMKVPKWTKDKPTEPGWYWAYIDSGIQILEVGYRTGGILSFWETGFQTPEIPNSLDRVDYWLGPIPEPGKPE